MVGSRFIIHSYSNMRNEKETVLDGLGGPRTGEQFDRRQSEKEMLEAIQAKNEEIAVLHTVNTRLGYELSVLQRKVGIDALGVVGELDKLGEVALGVHLGPGQVQYLDQLLLAYDETLLKQKKMIALLYSQLEDAEKRAEAIVRENEYLLEENKNKCKRILEIYHRGQPEENLNQSYSKLLKEMQEEKSLLVQEESEHILDSYRSIQNAHATLEAQIQEKKLAADQYYSAYHKQAQQLKDALLSVDNLLKVKEFLEKTVAKMGSENATLETSQTNLTQTNAKLENEVKSLRNQLFTQKRVAREEAERLTLQADSQKAESESAVRKERETFTKCMELERQVQTLNKRLAELSRENAKMKGEFEQTIKMVEAYESKVTVLQRKESSVQEMVEKDKENTQRTLMERDKAIMKIDQLNKIIEVTAGRHKDEMTRVRENYQKVLSELQEKIRNMADEKEESESLFTESELILKNQIEKLRRQNATLQEENLKFVENIHLNTGSEIIGKLKEHQQKNDSLLKMLSQKEKLLRESQMQAEETQLELEGQVRTLSRQLDKEKHAATNHMKEITQERSRVSILTNDKECLENEVRRLKRSNEQRNFQLVDEREGRIAELEGKLAESGRREKETRAKALEMLERFDESEEKLKLQFQRTIVELESENSKLRGKVERMKGRR